MTDIIDNALILEEEQRQQAIDRVVARHSVASDWCLECGITIPKARKEALPECGHCIQCATYLELLNKNKRATR